MLIGRATISNDGATIMKLLEIVHPAAKSLVDIARAQDAEVGDGTTSVVLLAGELLKEVRSFVEDSLSPRLIIQGFRLASQLAVDRVREAAVSICQEDAVQFRELLEKCASTSMNSKLIHSQKDFFKRLVVDAMLTLDPNDLNERLIGMKKVPGGALQVSAGGMRGPCER
jgi:T-complex protein 1 subunit eta